MRIRRLTYALGIALTAFGMPIGAVAARIKIPEQTVITTFDPASDDGEAAAETIATGAASGPVTSFTQADFARLGVVSSSYPETISIMRSVLNEIRAKSPMPSINPDIQIFNSTRPEGRALSRELIVVSTGFFKVLETEFPSQELQAHALAYLLAHEYAHLLYNHPAQYQEKLDDTKISTTIGEGYALLKTVQTTHNQFGGGGGNEAFYKAEKAFMGASAASPWIEAELYRATYAPYRREEEQMADFMATDLLLDVDNAETKYNAKEGASPMRSIYKSYDDSAKAQLKEIAGDVTQTTQQATKDIVLAAPTAMYANGEQFGNLIQSRMKRAAFDFLGRRLKARLNTKKIHLYYSADKRVDAIDLYADKFYPQKTERLSMADLAKLDIGGAFAKENTATSAAQQAMRLLARGDVGGARKAINSVSGASRYKNIAYIVAAADTAFAEGDLSEAIRLYRTAIRRDDAPVRAFSSLSKAHLRIGNDDKAIEALDIGAKRFSEKEFIVARINAFVALQRNEDAIAALSTCQSFGDEKLMKRCESAAEPAFPQEEKEDRQFFPLGNLLGDAINDIVD